jgi:osmotically-inducible protein OsmY
MQSRVEPSRRLVEVGLVAVLVAGCHQDGDTQVAPPLDLGGPLDWPLIDVPGEPGHQTQVPAPERVADAFHRELADEVAQALRADPITADEPIQVYAERERIVLGGTVRTLQAERQAMTIALSVSGATTVSHIRVDVPPRDDLDVQADVWRALRDEPTLNASRVGVRIEDGNIRLVGAVASEVERLLAEHVAAGVRGVRSIQNELVRTS